MEIIVGETAGFCAGVRNAVTKTEQILQNDKKICCLGELVHNRQVIENLEEKGLKTIENITEVNKGEKVVIRAHGVPKNVYEYAKKAKIEIVDLTCPKVLMIHKQAENLSKDGYFVILIAQKEHPEAIGTISFCGNNSAIIENIDEIPKVIKKINNSKKKNIAVVCQTTFSIKKFEEMCIALKDKLDINVNFQIYNTICNATSLRQRETTKIANNVEAMIIIGGKNSSNTRKLYEISKDICLNTFLIQTKEELEVEKLKSFNKIGVMAGASTPKESIESVIEKLKEISSNKILV